MLLKDAIYPLKNLTQFYSLMYLIHHTDNDSDYVSTSFNDIFNTNYNADTVNLLHSKFLNLFSQDEQDHLSLFSNLSFRVKNRKTFLLPPINKCLFCNFILESTNVSHKITAFCLDSPKLIFYKVK